MKKIYEKNETLFCILIIIAYVLSNSYFRQNYGYTSYMSAIFNTIFSLLLILLIIKLKRVKYYGLTKVNNIKDYLYFIPLIIFTTANVWNGININNSGSEILFYILTMINVGFIEEIIFRGFLFKMMEKDNIKTAIIVSSLTFGIGHIVNLLNGADFISTVIKIFYAISIGYLYVMIFYKSKSIVPCIISHLVFNSLGIFNVENTFSIYIVPVIIIVICISYATYINKRIN